MSSIPSNRSAWEGRDEEEGERGDGGVGKDVNQVGRHHWYSTKMHLFGGNYFLIPFAKSSFVWAILPSTIFTMSVTPRTATSLLSAILLIVDQEKSQFFRPLSTSFITLFKRQPSTFQPQSPLPPPDHGNLSACRAEPPSPQCLPAFGFLFIFLSPLSNCTVQAGVECEANKERRLQQLPRREMFRINVHL